MIGTVQQEIGDGAIFRGCYTWRKTISGWRKWFIWYAATFFSIWKERWQCGLLMLRQIFGLQWKTMSEGEREKERNAISAIVTQFLIVLNA